LLFAQQATYEFADLSNFRTGSVVIFCFDPCALVSEGAISQLSTGAYVSEPKEPKSEKERERGVEFQPLSHFPSLGSKVRNHWRLDSSDGHL